MKYNDSETSVVIYGDTPELCRVFTNDRRVITKMKRAGFTPTRTDGYGHWYLNIPTNRIFRPTKGRKKRNI